MFHNSWTLNMVLVCLCVYQVQDQTGSLTGSVQNKTEFADTWSFPATSCEG